MTELIDSQSAILGAIVAGIFLILSQIIIHITKINYERQERIVGLIEKISIQSTAIGQDTQKILDAIWKTKGGARLDSVLELSQDLLNKIYTQQSNLQIAYLYTDDPKWSSMCQDMSVALSKLRQAMGEVEKMRYFDESPEDAWPRFFAFFEYRDVVTAMPMDLSRHSRYMRRNVIYRFMVNNGLRKMSPRYIRKTQMPNLQELIQKNVQQMYPGKSTVEFEEK